MAAAFPSPLAPAFDASPEPGGGFRLPTPLMILGFALAIVGGFSDYSIANLPIYISDAHLWFCLGWIAVLVLADAGTWGEGPWRARLKVAGVGLGLTLAIAYGMQDLTDHLSRRRVIEQLLLSPSIYCWAATLWLASPLVLRDPSPPEGAQGGWAGGLFRGAWLALLTYGGLELASACASIDPRLSLRLYFQERALLFGLLAAWTRAAAVDDRLRTASGTVAVGWTGLLSLLAMVVGGVFLLAPNALRTWLIDNEYLFAQAPPTPGSPLNRLLFPMLHFNRTAYFGLLALALALAAWVGAANRAAEQAAFQAGSRSGRALGRALGRRWHGLFAAVVASAFLLIVFSYTRGVLGATLLAAMLGAMLLWRRMLWLMPLVLLAGGLLLPAQQRQHMMTMLEPETYIPGPGVEFTSMHARIHGWTWGLGRVAEYPLTGQGYGARLTRKEYGKFVLRGDNQRLIQDVRQGNELLHMHNVWLETAVQSGLPAMLALVLFFGCRYGLVLGWLWHTRGAQRRLPALWLTFECAFLISGLVFYILKQNFGYAFFFTWGWIMLAALQGWRATQWPADTLPVRPSGPSLLQQALTKARGGDAGGGKALRR